MSILFQISAVINKGAIGRIADQIGQTVIDKGWESYIAYARNIPSGSSSKTIKIGNMFDIYWHGINSRIFDNHGLCSNKATIKLVRQIDKIKPDIILLHNIHGYYLNYKLLFNYLLTKNIPIIWILHDCWSFTGHCVHFDYIGCDKWKSQCKQCPQKTNYPASFFLDKSLRNFFLKKQLFNQVENMTIVTVSRWLGDMVKQSFLKQNPVQVIYNGIDTEIFLPKTDIEHIKKKYDVNGKFIILGIANVWDERKGLQDFIELYQYLNDSYQIILVGLNKKQKKSLPKGIIGITQTENILELVDLYSIADIHVSCSVEETFGLTIVESMACGTPVIVYNCTSLPELVDNSTGIIVEKRNVKELYKAILAIKEKTKKFYSENCRKRAVFLFNKNDQCNKYLELFNQLINSI